MKKKKIITKHNKHSRVRKGLLNQAEPTTLPFGFQLYHQGFPYRFGKCSWAQRIATTIFIPSVIFLFTMLLSWVSLSQRKKSYLFLNVVFYFFPFPSNLKIKCCNMQHRLEEWGLLSLLYFFFREQTQSSN